MKAGKRVLTGVLTGIMALTLLAGVPMGKDGVVNAARRTLKGPSANSEGVVTWDCVYFGSYPQSDATGQKKDPIKWRVLSVNGDDAFLVADSNLDLRKYNETRPAITWETCTMRSWLNGYGGSSNVCGTDYSSDSFLSSAFTALEQAAIHTVTVVNANNPEFGTAGGSNTQDKIFLLSLDEIRNPSYGFSSDYHALGDETKRMNTAYVAAGGTMGATGWIGDEGTADWWWLRSPGILSNYAANVFSDGEVSRHGDYVDNSKGVCPALHLKLSSSEVWTYAGTVSSDGTSTGCPHENTELRGKKEACIEIGYTGDTYCSDCEAKIKSGEAIPSKGGHQWDSGILTKPATVNEDAVRTFTCMACGETRTETVVGTSALVNVPKAVQAVTDDSIAAQSSEDVKGAVFNALQARSTKLTNKSVTLKWKKVSGADGYKVYGNRCGKKNHYKLIADMGRGKTSYTQKKLKKGTYYKYVVAAYKIVDGEKVTMAVSKTIHAATTGGKYGVAKSVNVNKSKITLKKGGKFTIKAQEVKKDKTIKHHRKIAYESDNSEIATVSAKGVAKAKKKGSCYIYVYAQNGVYKRVKVTVK
ncbi:MAG: fibronectin type III domain-containing protein [Lachnospiraceae bacterium]|nr:fibronectin type III domain-containing protein [Lachnospiraceae bacterium]